MKLRLLSRWAWCLWFLCLATAQAQQTARAPSEPETPQVAAPVEAQVSVLRLMKFSGVLKDRLGNPRTGVVGLTFALYKDSGGGAPLWLEVENAQLDEQGRYTVLLGSTRSEGLPLELFTTGEARWLGVQANLPGEEEQPRVLLVSVPYALKAADAETLGGKPPSAFLLAERAGSAGESLKNNGEELSREGIRGGPERFLISGTPNRIAKFNSLGNDVVDTATPIFESGTNIGIGTTSLIADANVPVQINAPGGGIAYYGANKAGNYGALFGFDHTLVGVPAAIVRVVQQPDPLVFVVNNTAEAMRITSSGNVGIGTGGPTAKLDVSGLFSVAAFRGNSTDAVMTFQNAAAGGNSWDVVSTANGSAAGAGKFSIAKTGVAHYFTIDGVGNLGIGTTAPSQKLEVAGNLKVSGTPGTNGIIFPDGSLQITACGANPFSNGGQLLLDKPAFSTAGSYCNPLIEELRSSLKEQQTQLRQMQLEIEALKLRLGAAQDSATR